MLRRDLSENVSFLQMVWLFSLQQEGERFHGIEHVRALIEHHALGPMAHRSVGDFGACG